jgi:simple sugar transport system substrate-binding protein
MNRKGQASSMLIIVAVICIAIGAGVGWIAKPVGELAYVDPYTGDTFASMEALAAHINATYRPIFTLPGSGITVDYFSHGIPGDPYWAVVKRGAEDAAALFGVDMNFIFGLKDDISAHVAMLEESVAGQPDAIILAPYYPQMNDTIVTAKAAGILVMGNANEAAREWTEAFVGYTVDTYGSGWMVAHHVADLIDIGAHVVIPMEVAGAFYAEERSRGFYEGLEDAKGWTGAEAGTPEAATADFTWEKLDAGYETAITESRINAYMLGHEETTVIYNVGGLTTERAGVVVESLGFDPGEIVVCGNDLLPETAQAIVDGYNQGVFYGQQYLLGFDNVVVAYQVVKYGFAPYDVLITASMIDGTNIQQALANVAAGIF